MLAPAMPGKFDASAKFLVETYPADWLAYLGIALTDTVEVLGADLSTVSAEADKVVLVTGPSPWLVHLEFQSSYDPTMGRRLVRYSTMLHVQHELPVASILVLLRRSAGGPAITGRYRASLPGGSPYLSFTYAVRRIWREPASDLLGGPLGTLPMAPLGMSTRSEVPGLLRAMDERFTQEAPRDKADQLRVVTYTLLGLRFLPEIADQMMPGLRAMRDSLTYQAILAEGEATGLAKGEHRLILREGTRRLGAPDDLTRSRIEAITDLDRLEQIFDRIAAASTWSELFADEP
jgi:predicted transposase YdaD